MKKFLHFDWMRAVQFLGNTVPKKEIQCQKKKFIEISLDFKLLNFRTTHEKFVTTGENHEHKFTLQKHEVRHLVRYLICVTALATE